MRCNTCNTENEQEAVFCSGCGQRLITEEVVNNTEEIVVEESNNNIEKPIKNKPKLNIYIIIIFILLIILGCLIYLLLKPKREDILKSSKDSSFTFKIKDDEFNIISTFKDFSDKGYYVESNNYFIKHDSVAIDNIYKDGEAVALAAFYCPNENGCNYKDTNIVKLNFYTSQLEVKGVKNSDSYTEIVKKLGEESGVLSSDNSYCIWSFGKNIGDPYIMIKFSGSKKGFAQDIKIGVWWYEEEYQNSVSKVKESDKDEK